MEAILLTWAFVIGVSCGSFVGVLVERWNIGKSIVKPGSMCLSCGNKLKWWHNIPVVSYILLGGKCAFCKTEYGSRHVWLEITAGFLSSILVLLYNYQAVFLLALPLLYLLIAVAADSAWYGDNKVAKNVWLALIVAVILFTISML